jgi:glycosyltransferase involved in cell wall biosynthesis
MKKLLSIVVPCFNEEPALKSFYEVVDKVSREMLELDFEFVFVDDGSRDGTLKEIEKLREGDKRVKFVSFSRNFGKEAALLAGLDYANGDYVATMDADLQDPPALLPEMYEAIKDGEYDCVATRRVTREGEPPIRSFFARIFYRLINKMSKIEMVDGARDYRLMTRQMVDAIISMREYNRYSKGLFSFVGFRTKWIEFQNVQRVAGETHWSFWKLFVYAIDGICAFSTVPLVIAAVLGLLFCMLAFIMIMVIIVKTLLYGDPVGGWPSTICVILMVGGIQLLALGIIGEYLAKTYLETKHRPIYIIKSTEKDK